MKLASTMVGEVFILHLTDLQVNLANWRLLKNNLKFSNPKFSNFLCRNYLIIQNNLQTIQRLS